MTHLFKEIEERHKPLEELAKHLWHLSSLLDLHAWYQSRAGSPEPNLLAASQEAEAAARILLGEPIPTERDRNA